MSGVCVLEIVKARDKAFGTMTYISKDHCLLYSGTSLIRTSLNRNLSNPNGKALVNFFFFFLRF